MGARRKPGREDTLPSAHQGCLAPACVCARPKLYPKRWGHTGSAQSAWQDTLFLCAQRFTENTRPRSSHLSTLHSPVNTAGGSALLGLVTK